MAATWMALWLALAPTATPSPAPRPPLPERRGAAVVGVAVGVQVLGAAGTFASSWALDRRCTTSGRTDLAASVQCMADHAARRPVMYLGMLASRGT
ncbi:MAG: hypothetical protein KDK70_01070, partial [Myxococcales bacterium]|nr:hypothetical protein [Myxococcales bacterium]